MRNELKAFDMRDSVLFRQSMSISRKMSGHYSLEQSTFHEKSTMGQHKQVDQTMIRELFLQPKAQVKTFNEIITHTGKQIGKLRGTLKIYNLPML